MIGEAPAGGKPKRQKYGNKKVTVTTPHFGVVTFDSTAEYKRYLHHATEMQHGSRDYTLERQVDYKLAVNGIHICVYRADFVLTYKDGRKVVEDVKGVRTEAYKLKKSLMKAVHGIDIVEIGEQKKKPAPKESKRAGRKVNANR